MGHGTWRSSTFLTLQSTENRLFCAIWNRLQSFTFAGQTFGFVNKEDEEKKCRTSANDVVPYIILTALGLITLSIIWSMDGTFSVQAERDLRYYFICCMNVLECSSKTENNCQSTPMIARYYRRTKSICDWGSVAGLDVETTRLKNKSNSTERIRSLSHLYTHTPPHSQASRHTVYAVRSMCFL